MLCSNNVYKFSLSSSTKSCYEHNIYGNKEFNSEIEVIRNDTHSPPFIPFL